MTPWQHNPGSPQAVKNGCTCPRMDNAHGAGYLGGVKGPDGGTVFVITGGCPLHDETARPEREEA